VYKAANDIRGRDIPVAQYAQEVRTDKNYRGEGDAGPHFFLR